jgi:3-isopropylmalate/(R)-2-methylmalate dehydratase small subunit
MKFKAKSENSATTSTPTILPSGVLPAGRGAAEYVFHANRPGWADEVKPGDILIGGKNFGMGSSRPAARSLKNLGLACLVAPSINGLFFRNCVNFAFPAIECPGVHEAFHEGEMAEVDFESAVVRNVTRGVTLNGRPLPPQLMELVKAGGIYPLLEKEGLIEPRAEKA